MLVLIMNKVSFFKIKQKFPSKNHSSKHFDFDFFGFFFNFCYNFSTESFSERKFMINPFIIIIYFTENLSSIKVNGNGRVDI